MAIVYHIEFNSNQNAIEKARKKIEDAENAYHKLLEESENIPISENTTILCKKCGKRTKIGNIKYSDRYWYERPHGCMGGDEWHLGGHNIECPKCNHVAKSYKPNGLFSTKEESIQFNILLKLLKFAIKCEDAYERS